MLDIPVPTIRSWERRYGIPTPHRTDGKHRRFSRDEIVQLRELRDEIAKGRRTQEAARIVKGKGLLKQPGGEQAAGILDAALRFDAASIRALMDEAYGSLGLEMMVQHVALPVLRDIGTLWEAGKCDVANEHLASQEIRAWMNTKLAWAKAKTDKGPVILATGPKDQHTLGLEAFYLILTNRGWVCRVLGGLTPTASLVKIVTELRPKAVIISSHMNTNRRDAVASIQSVAALAPTFYAGNAFALPKAREGIDATFLGEALPEAADRLEAALAS